MNFRKVLKFLYVIQEKYLEKEEAIYGKDAWKVRRLNPYNPLSYITIILGFILGIILFGVYGFWEEIEMRNPFKWY